MSTATATGIERYQDTGDGEIVPAQEVAMSALEALTRAEIDIQVATARKYPRSIMRFQHEARSLACLNPEIAGSCIYAVPRDGKTIVGPSVRLAEIVAHSFGNLRVVTRISQETERFLVAQATALDLEKNSGVQVEVRRRITRTLRDRDGNRIRDRDGNDKCVRYGDDMITTTANAALSIAYRNAVFRIVPAAFTQPVYDAARRLAGGGGRSVEEGRRAMLGWARSLGVTPAEVYGFLKVQGEADVTLEHMEVLAGIRTAIKDGETTVDEVFRPRSDEPEPGRVEGSKVERMAADLAGKARARERRPARDAQPAPVPANPDPDEVSDWPEGRE